MKKWLLITTLTVSLFGCSPFSPPSASSNAGADSDVDKKLMAANANIQLGMNYLQDGHVETAKQKLLLALELAPKYPPAWYTMAYYLEVTGNIQKANQYYLQAIRLAPKNGDVKNNYGTFLCHVGKAKASIPYFIAATQDPTYIETSAAYENAGLCALLIPDIQQAKEYFNKALMNDPNRTRSLFELATINEQQGHYALAQQQINTLLSQGNKTPDILALQARINRRV